MRFKNIEGKPERESPKRTISACCGLELLQMVSEQDTGWCANKDAGSSRGGGGGVDCEIPHRLERGAKHSL